MRKFLLATALTLVMAPAMAKSSGWYVMNFKEAKCSTAAKEMGELGVGYTPEEFHSFLRKNSILDAVDVIKNNEGEVTLVLIKAKTIPHSDEMVEFYWFPSLEMCEFGRQVMIKTGEMAEDMDDLK